MTSRRKRQPEQGQAFTETLIVSWLLLVFIGGIWQLFIVNDTIFRTISAAHSMLFTGAFARNNVNTLYSADDVYVVLDRAGGIPEAEIPVIGMFRKAVGQDTVRIRSTVTGGSKKLRMGSGTAGPSGLLDYGGHILEMGWEVATHPGEYLSAYVQRVGW